MAEYELKCGTVVIVDESTLEWVSLSPWRVYKGKVVSSDLTSGENGKAKRTTIFLSRQVAADAGWEIEHKQIKHRNGNTLDCRLDNLYFAEKRKRSLRSKVISPPIITAAQAAVRIRRGGKVCHLVKNSPWELFDAMSQECTGGNQPSPPVIKSVGSEQIIIDKFSERLFDYYKWRITGGQVVCSKRKRFGKRESEIIRLARAVAKQHRWPIDGKAVKHKNGNKLDCRIENLYVPIRRGRTTYQKQYAYITCHFRRGNTYHATIKKGSMQFDMAVRETHHISTTLEKLNQ